MARGIQGCFFYSMDDRVFYNGPSMLVMIFALFTNLSTTLLLTLLLCWDFGAVCFSFTCCLLLVVSLVFGFSFRELEFVIILSILVPYISFSSVLSIKEPGLDMSQAKPSKARPISITAPRSKLSI